MLSGIAATFENAVPYHLHDRDGDLDGHGYEMLILAWWNECRQPDRYNVGSLEKAERIANCPRADPPSQMYETK